MKIIPEYYELRENILGEIDYVMNGSPVWKRINDMLIDFGRKLEESQVRRPKVSANKARDEALDAALATISNSEGRNIQFSDFENFYHTSKTLADGLRRRGRKIGLVGLRCKTFPTFVHCYLA